MTWLYPDPREPITPTAPYVGLLSDDGVWNIWVSGRAPRGLRLEVDARLSILPRRGEFELHADVGIRYEGGRVERVENLRPYLQWGAVRDGSTLEVVARFWLPIREGDLGEGPARLAVRLWEEDVGVAPVECRVDVESRRV